MQRRHFLAASGLLIASSGHAETRADKGTDPRADAQVLVTLDDVKRWLDTLESAPAPRTTGRWPLVAVLTHEAQSIDMSIDGFPRPYSALFQQTVGAAAFSFFRWRGRMSHDLAEPIPGAPDLPQSGDFREGVQRLRSAIARFEAHTGALQPHFAYGELSKPDFAKAHVMHIANHLDEISVIASPAG